jgi:hypothetical protein
MLIRFYATAFHFVDSRIYQNNYYALLVYHVFCTTQQIVMFQGSARLTVRRVFLFRLSFHLQRNRYIIILVTYQLFTAII